MERQCYFRQSETTSSRVGFERWKEFVGGTFGSASEKTFKVSGMAGKKMRCVCKGPI